MELKGKYIAFLGDSITEGVGVTDQSNRYDNVIAREYSLAKAENLSVSGSRLAHQSVPSEKPHYDLCFCGRAAALDESADICVVYGGVNDYIHGDAYIGEETDSTPATFIGGVNFLMNALKAYADIIIEAGRRNGVHVLDLFRELPINPNKPEDFERYTTDGLHLNDEGHIMLAHLLARFIEKI